MNPSQEKRLLNEPKIGGKELSEQEEGKKIDEDEEPTISLVVKDGVANDIEIQFSAEIQSKYDNPFSISCSGRKSCYETNAIHNQAPPEMPTSYQPMDDGFSVQYIVVGNRTLGIKNTSDLDLIVYGPEEIHGDDNESLVLGVTPNKQDCLISWLLNETTIAKANGYLGFYSKEPGNYKCKSWCGEEAMLSNTVTVVKHDLVTVHSETTGGATSSS